MSVVQPVPRSMMNAGIVDMEVQWQAVHRQPGRPAPVHGHTGTPARQACMLFALAHEANTDGKAAVWCFNKSGKKYGSKVRNANNQAKFLVTYHLSFSSVMYLRWAATCRGLIGAKNFHNFANWNIKKLMYQFTKRLQLREDFAPRPNLHTSMAYEMRKPCALVCFQISERTMLFPRWSGQPLRNRLFPRRLRQSSRIRLFPRQSPDQLN